MKEKIANFIATGFYSGYCPKAPGTAGSVAAFGLIFLLYSLAPTLATFQFGLILAITTSIVGIISSNIVCDSGRYGKDKKDPQQIVIDEFAGYFISIIGLPPKILPLLLGLACFRLFDISKLPPIKRLESFPRGYGIMFDDMLAGVYAACLARLILQLIG